nr:early nodulin-like protein 2 [Coffea arabica]
MADHKRHPSVFLLCMASFIISSYAYQFSVGGRDGWVVKPSEDYNHWAGRMRFQVNDTLFFKYKKGSNSVLVVNKDDYDKCNVDKPIIKLEDGNSIFKFDRSGPFYFISGNKTYCDQGQKMIVHVLAVRTPPKPPASPPSPSPRPAPAVSPISPPSTAPTPAGSPSLSPPSSAPTPAGSPSLSPSSSAPTPAGSPSLSPPSSAPTPAAAGSPSSAPTSPTAPGSPGPAGANSPPGPAGGNSPPGPAGANSPPGPGSSSRKASGYYFHCIGVNNFFTCLKRDFWSIHYFGLD